MTKPLELQGQRFGRLVAISRAENSKAGKTRWNCFCDCQIEVVCAASDLTSGHTTSCGCVHSEQIAERNVSNIQHGMCNSGLYRTWAAMKSRCTDINQPAYKDYGGRGITVCPEWLENFESFKNDMESSYQEGLTLDRKNNNEGYCKNNCRWATRKEQQRNRRNNVWINTPLGRMVASEAAERFRLSRNVIYQRIRKGWPEERLLEKAR